VLHVQRGVDVETGGQEILHVLPALLVATAGRVRMRQLVHEEQAGPAGQRGIQVEFEQGGGLVGDRAAGYLLKALEQPGRFGPAVRFDEADDHGEPLGLLQPGGLEHGKRLAHAGRRAEEYLEMSAPCARFLVIDLRQERVGIGPAGRQRCHARSAKPESARAGGLTIMEAS
jgi:hypothetical protein